MSKLYTVEPFSTYHGIPVKEDDLKKQYFLSLSGDFFEANARRIYVSKVDTPKIFNEKLAMLSQERIRFGVIKKIKSKYILKKSRGRDNSKILLSSYKVFKVLKGIAHYVIEPEESDHYVLIIIEKDTILKLFNRDFGPRIVRFNDLI